MSEMTNSFQAFQRELREKIRMAERAGLGRDTIARQAEELGDWLARHAEPRNPEERLLRELWAVADEREQQALADVLVKFAERS